MLLAYKKHMEPAIRQGITNFIPVSSPFINSQLPQREYGHGSNRKRRP